VPCKNTSLDRCKKNIPASFHGKTVGLCPIMPPD